LREQWAFVEAYERYGGLLYSAAYNVVRNAEDAEDCVHDALLRIWKTPDAYSTQRGALVSFLSVCVRNRAISMLRSQSRRSRLADRAAAAAAPSQATTFEIPDFIEHARLRDAIATLPVEQRTPLLLAYYDGKTHVQIAKELDWPLGTVKSRLSLGVKRLGNMLREGAAV
jgi:RNA polymerase sigma-70 factor (ECF subfamily)